MGIDVDLAGVEVPGSRLKPRPNTQKKERLDMRQAIIDRQVKAMAAHQLDAMVSCSPENYAYATGFVVPSQPLIRHRHAMVIVGAERFGAAVFGRHGSEHGEAPRARRADAHLGGVHQSETMLVLADQLKSMGLAHARIGIEMDYLPAGDLIRFQQPCPARASSAASRSWRGCGS